jgi:hypothetical protein
MCLLAVVGGASPATARQAATQPAAATGGVPQRATLLKLMRPVSVDLQDKRLEDIVSFIATSSGADLEPMWADDKNTEGLDKEHLVTVRVQNQTYLQLIERVMETARSDIGGANTWQMSDTGAIQFGPKERLNKFKRVQIYDINDLVMEVPDYTDVPRIDLQQALQSSQGGGGGQSPFREAGNNDQAQRTRDRQLRIDEVVQLIQQIVEPDQWVENGGSGGSVKVFRGALIVNAPDYMQRGIDGYPYWPSAATKATMSQGRRYVTLNGDTGVSRLDGFGQAPVSAVVGGQVIRSGGPPAIPPGGR